MHLIYSHNKLGAKLQTILTMQLFDFNDNIMNMYRFNKQSYKMPRPHSFELCGR